MPFRKGFWFILLFLVATSVAQQGYPFYRVTKDDMKVNPFRYMLNKVSLSMDFGYGNTYFDHAIPGGMLRDSTSAYLDVGGGVIADNWFNRFSTSPYDTTAIRQIDGGYPLLFSNTTPVYPLTFSLHIELNRFKVGAGGSLLFHRFRPFTGIINDTVPLTFTPDEPGGLIRDLHLMGGIKVWEYGNYRFDADVRFGLTRFSRSRFDVGQISAPPYFAISASAAKVYSEYLRVYVRPSYTFRTFDMGGIRHNAPSFMVHIGFVFNFPEIPRSPIKNDHTQMKHIIRDPKTDKLKYVRGQPFWREQNPKPGELYPVYKKYKWYNRWKWNPY